MSELLVLLSELLSRPPLSPVPWGEVRCIHCKRVFTSVEEHKLELHWQYCPYRQLWEMLEHLPGFVPLN